MGAFSIRARRPVCRMTRNRVARNRVARGARSGSTLAVSLLRCRHAAADGFFAALPRDRHA
ncbi:hypothetical protein AQ477_12945 [Burkholderia thailandensis]|nr:hypothetical protein AQ477_12945 [Burkholderia thailandensis]PNE74115.1 hypothetical protein A8H37_19810 [Burkholderia thailandensis]